MKLMVIGGGGREHTIIKKLKENPAVETIYALPGNGGIAADAVCVPEIGAKDIPAQVEFAKAKGIDYEVQKLPMVYAGRFVAETEGMDGLCKILVDKKRRTILGVHLLGAYAGEIIWGAAEMLEMQLRVEDARQIIFPHPTVSEVIRETLWEFAD